MPTTTPAQKREQEKQVVGLMIELYCHGHHGTCGHTLCPDCEALRNYADARVDHCPHMKTKTFCSACKTHCYKPQMCSHNTADFPAFVGADSISGRGPMQASAPTN